MIKAMQTKYFLVVLCLFCTSMGFTQNKLFDKYADMDNVTSVHISKTMLKMMPKIETAGVNLMNLKGKVESLVLVSTENKNKKKQMKKDFSKSVTSRRLQELMRVKDNNRRVSFYSDSQDDRIKELLMLIENNTAFMAILLVGDFTLKDIQEIAEKKE